MKQKVSVLFFLYKSKLNKVRDAPIYTRITINKERKHFSTGFFISLSHWDSKHHRIKSSNHLAKQINAHLDAIQRKAIELALKFEFENKVFSAEDFISELLGRKNISIKSLLAVFQKHNDGVKELIGKSYTTATYKKFEGFYKQVQDFIKHQYQREDVLLLNLKLKFILEFEHYLLSIRGMKQVSINKSTQRLKKIIKYAIMHEYLEKDPFALHKAKSVKQDVIFLNPEELLVLENHQFDSERLTKVQDCFIFCCYTGLAYREMSQLTQQNIVVGFDHKNWIKIVRQKTNKPLMIPILPKAAEILKKYSTTVLGEKLLPVISNQRFNTYLKDIAAETEIQKKLTHHVARKTFASTVLLYNDVPMEVVSELLGHSDIKITQQHYAKVANKKLSQHMERVAEKLK